MKSMSLAAKIAALCAAVVGLAWTPALAPAAAAQAGMDVAAIVARVDANASFASLRYEARMEITVNGSTRVKAMTCVAMGRDRALIEFLNPEDRGTRMLKLAGALWMWFPKEQDTVRIAGRMLKEGLMGSDISYEEAMESESYASGYEASLAGRESLDGRDCYVLELVARAQAPGAQPARYQRRRAWIDAERFLVLKEEMYARSGKLLKTSAVREAGFTQGRWYARRSELSDAMRSGTRTVIIMDSIEFDPRLDEGMFTMDSLKR